MPQPAKSFLPCFIVFVFLSFIIAVVKGPNWAQQIVIALAGISIFLFGLCVFRDIKGAATSWSRLYKESKGIAPDGFTFADVPTIKGMGFVYMGMGVMFAVMAIFWAA